MFEGKIFTAVLGMSSGLTVQRWSAKGVETVCQLDIPWAIEWVSSKKMIYWPNKWLENVVGMVNSYAEKGDTIAWAMPGADIACIKKYRSGPAFCLALSLLNYRSFADGAIFETINKLVAPKEAYLKMHGANWAFFQPPSHIHYYLNELEKDPDIRVVPLADWITYLANGGNAKILTHDPIMLQSMGAYGIDSAGGIYSKLFGKNLAERVFPFDAFPPGSYFIRDDNQVKIVSCSHDSVYARKIGFSVCPSGIWTGTWVGTGDRIGDKNIQPSGETFDAGVAFEGLGLLRALITNIAMAGGVYKAIIKKFKWSYEYAAEYAEETIDEVGAQVAFDIEELPADADTAAEFILKKGCDLGGLALAYLLLSLAAACWQKKQLVYGILRKKAPKKVAVFGGFAENPAFLKALKLFGFDPVVPPFAANATHAGLAMEALVRTNEAVDDQEALAILQGLSSQNKK